MLRDILHSIIDKYSPLIPNRLSHPTPGNTLSLKSLVAAYKIY
jgi:hypothetical protein